MQLSQYYPTLLEYRGTSLIHTITLIINHLSNPTLDNLDTTSQAWASIISSVIIFSAQGIGGEYEGNEEVDVRVAVDY